MIDVARFLPAAQRAQTIISQVLDNRPGTHSEYVQGWVLRGTQQNDVIFYAVLDAQRILHTVRYDYLTAQYERQQALLDIDELRATQLRRPIP